ncbi:MAG: glycosyltransferase family 2 protein [Acidobacteria bacterium]|nr:glycosyltransferase family 2 protein [Acidobacteriota bacterium]
MISIIIVAYNSREHIRRCLTSFQDSGAEIVVVDNASSDGTAALMRQAFPTVRLIAAPKNLGFAAGANLGVRNSTGTALLFVNPDVVCLEPFARLEQMLNESPDTVAIAPRLVDVHGRTQIGFNVRRLPTAAALIFEMLTLNRFFPNNSVNRHYRCLDFDHGKPGEIEQPAAACLLVRRRSFEEIGGFDERFFPLWFEDVDLCLRLRQHGGRILYTPQIPYEHSGGHSLESVTFSERQVYWYRNLLYYVGKHFGWAAGLFIRAALLIGVGLRIAAELFGIFRRSHRQSGERAERVHAYLEAAKLSFLGWR